MTTSVIAATATPASASAAVASTQYDRFGAITLPVRPVAVTITDTPGDPALGYLLSFFKAVLNAKVQAAFTLLMPGARSDTGVPLPVVATTCPFDPSEGAFNTDDLPALYMWRSEMGEPIDVAPLWTTRLSTLTWRWAGPIVPDGENIDPIVNAIHAALKNALRKGRDPAWYVAGDDYPQQRGDSVRDAARTVALGSVLAHWTKHFRLHLGPASRKAFIVEIQDGDSVRRNTYGCLEGTIALTEHIEIGTAGSDLLDGADGTILTGIAIR